MLIHTNDNNIIPNFKAFQEVVKKDGHLAVGHFMLGVVNLMCTR